MAQDEGRDRYRELPEPVRVEDLVESVDTRQLPARDRAQEERDRLLRDAAG